MKRGKNNEIFKNLNEQMLNFEHWMKKFGQNGPRKCCMEEFEGASYLYAPFADFYGHFWGWGYKIVVSKPVFHRLK